MFKVPNSRRMLSYLFRKYNKFSLAAGHQIHELLTVSLLCLPLEFRDIQAIRQQPAGFSFGEIFRLNSKIRPTDVYTGQAITYPATSPYHNQSRFSFILFVCMMHYDLFRQDGLVSNHNIF